MPLGSNSRYCCRDPIANNPYYDITIGTVLLEVEGVLKKKLRGLPAKFKNRIEIELKSQFLPERGRLTWKCINFPGNFGKTSKK